VKCVSPFYLDAIGYLLHKKVPNSRSCGWQAQGSRTVTGLEEPTVLPMQRLFVVGTVASIHRGCLIIG
jgi:hypothetical protein